MMMKENAAAGHYVWTRYFVFNLKSFLFSDKAKMKQILLLSLALLLQIETTNSEFEDKGLASFINEGLVSVGHTDWKIVSTIDISEMKEQQVSTI